MKQPILFLLLLICMAGCKKSGSDKPKEVLLSVTSTDGVVNSRIFYNDDNKLTRYDSYSGNVINSYFLVQYDAGSQLASMNFFQMPGDIPSARYLFESDGQGHVTKATYYNLQGPTPNTPDNTAIYSYNAEKLMIKIVRRDKNNVLIQYANLSYFPDDNLKEVQLFKEASGQLWLSGKIVYSVPNGFYPKGVDQLKTLLGPDVTASLYSEAIHNYSYDQNGAIVTHTSSIMSSREFSDDGALKRQVQTYTSIKPVQAPVVYNKAYEYITQ